MFLLVHACQKRTLDTSVLECHTHAANTSVRSIGDVEVGRHVEPNGENLKGVN